MELLLFPVRAGWRVLRWSSRAFLVLLIVGLLTLNVASLTLDGVNRALSQMVELIDPDLTIRRRATAEKAELEAALERANASAGERQERLRAAEERIRNLEADVDVERARARRLGTELEVAARERDAARLARGRIDGISRRIAIRGAEVATANIGSMPLEAVPYLGAAVIVAATAYELSAACETAKDMAEIREAMGFDADSLEGDDAKVCGMKVPSAEELWETLMADPGHAQRSACREAREQDLPLPQGCDTPPPPPVTSEAESPREPPDRPE